MGLAAWMKAHGCQSKTTLPRAALALFTGAGVGGALTGAVPVATELASGAFRWSSLFSGFLISGVAAVVWAIGLLLVGVPAWWLMHRLYARCTIAAMLLGLTACFVVGVLITQQLLFGVLLGVGGAVVGMVIRRIAYVQTETCALQAEVF